MEAVKFITYTVLFIFTWIVGFATGKNWESKTENKEGYQPNKNDNPLPPGFNMQEYEKVILQDENRKFIKTVYIERPAQKTYVIEHENQYYIYVGGAYQLTHIKKTFTL